MSIFTILQLLGGIGLFLFGMSLMGTYLTSLAGSSLERVLESLTTSKKKGVGFLKGWGLGTAVTAIIQSSAATTIMLIGFVNAGIMNLTQAVPVVLGSNVGSTVTAQILRLGDVSSQSVALQLLKPSSFAPMLVGIGAFIYMFTKSKKAKNVAGILIGLGILFYGMTTMESAFEPLRDSAVFKRMFTTFSNPLIGILTGLVITAIIQSSSASVGILQALSATGSVTYAVAIPILIGQNLGKCLTVIMGSVGTGKKAKRVSLSYLLVNIIGAVLFTVVIYALQYTVGLPFFNNAVNRGSIANMHLGFNLVTSILLLPFTEQLVKLTGSIVGREKVDPAEEEFAKLDDRLLNTPFTALRQCRHLAKLMSRRISANYKTALDLLYTYDEQKLEAMAENENFIDRCETVLSSYIIKIDRSRLPKSQVALLNQLLNTVNDLERLGDYAINIAYIAREMNEGNISFSETGLKELDIISSAASYCMETLWNASETDNTVLASRIEPLHDTIARLRDIIKAAHIRRLSDGKCSVAAGIHLNDLLTCFERIGAHSANVALQVIAKNTSQADFDAMHGHPLAIDSEEYKSLRTYYETQYVVPLEKAEEAYIAENMI